jgi:glycine oxidase
MISLSGMRMVVAGGGAVGSAVALAVRRAGAEVVLADPARLGENASGVAAGMLAPAFEAALDPVSAGHFGIYRQARDRWPSFAASLGRGDLLNRCGAMWAQADSDGVADMGARLEALGGAVEMVLPEEAARRAPGLAAPAGAVFTDEDWRLDPSAVLGAMRQALHREGGTVRAARLTGFTPGRVVLSDGAVEADALVIATGLAPAGWPDPPAELQWLSPIKGQILRAGGSPPLTGPVVRGPGIYVVPDAGGPWIGATMQAGLDDCAIDTEVSARLQDAAAALFPGLAQAPATALAGVRATTPDGLPLVGESSRPGVFLALGARRNGWLLAPTLALAVVEALGGRQVAAYLSSRRFDPTWIRAG